MADDIRGCISTNLSRCRRLRGRTQKQLATELGCSAQLISRYENGLCDVPASVLYNISLVLGIPVSEFFRAPVALTSDKNKNQLTARSIGTALVALNSVEIGRAIAGLIGRTLELQNATDEY
jgi:transcriptional regulator with XRE-family HTH domain